MKLKQTWNENQGEAETTKGLLTSHVFNDSRYKAITNFYAKHHNENDFQGLIIGIRDKLIQISKPITANSTAGTADNTSTALKDTSKTTDSAEVPVSAYHENSGMFEGVTLEIDVIALGFSLLGLVAIYFLIAPSRNIQRLKEWVRKKIDESHRDRMSNYVPNNNYDTQIKELRSELAYLKQSVQELKIKALASTVPMEITPPPEIYKPQLSAIKTESPAEIFYLPTPGADGGFIAGYVSNSYKEGASIYRATKISPDRARFQIDDHETSVILALQYAELRIEPCCRPLNAYNGNASRIGMIKPGLLELRGEKWMVVEKAEIRYEN